MSNRRFEINEIEQRDGAVHISVTVFRAIAGSEVRVGANYQRTETIFITHWRYKDGHLLTLTDRSQWGVPAEQNDETDFVLSALKSHGYM